MELNGIKNILIVEDHFNFRRAMIEILKDNFLEVNFMEAEDGETALESLRVHVPEIVLTDLHMPRMDGFEFLKQAVPIYRFTKFVAMTSYYVPEYQVKAINLGACAFFAKATDGNGYQNLIQLIYRFAYS